MAVQGLLLSQSVYSVRFVVQDLLNTKSPGSQVKSGYGFRNKNSSFVSLSTILTEADVNSDVTGAFISLLYILVRISTRMTASLKGRNIPSQCIDHTRKRQQNKLVVQYIRRLVSYRIY